MLAYPDGHCVFLHSRICAFLPVFMIALMLMHFEVSPDIILCTGDSDRSPVGIVINSLGKSIITNVLMVQY